MILQTKNLHIGYDTRAVAKNINLKLSPGEILCLLGPNGCGKTTLFKTILGLQPALAGDVFLGNDAIESLSRKHIAQRIAYVPQLHAPSFPFPALEIVLMGRTARLGAFAQPSAHDREIAMSALSKLGIAHLALADYARLSGGQRQLVMIARALAQQTSAIVMDEPTASLDFGNQVQVMEQISRLSRGIDAMGCGILISTHNPDHAFALKARVLLMHEGKVMADGSAESVLTSENLSLVYGVAVQVARTDNGRRVCLPN